jgi:hypothetical protein
MFCRLVSLVCLCVAVAIGGVACGPDTNGNNGGGTTPEAFEEDVTNLFADSICTSVYQCAEEQNPQITLFASRYGNEADCRQNILSLFEGELALNFASSVDAGLSEFNADKAQECMDAFEELASDQCFDVSQNEGTPSPACDQVLTGLQPAGAACDSDDHCASGDCDFSADVGDACWSGECADITPEEPVIQSAGDSCSESNEYCDTSAGLVCDTDESGENDVCVAVDTRAEGAACESSAVCNSGLACVENTCTTLQLGAEGDSCDFQSTFCQAGLVCSLSVAQGVPTGSCTPPKAQGEECFQDFACEDGLQCDGADLQTGTAGTCESTLAEGEECDSDIDCQQGLTCQEADGGPSTCQQPVSETCDIRTDEQMM